LFEKDAFSVLKVHIKKIFFLFAVWVVFHKIGISCPVLFLTGLPCPSCGATRALLALLSGDIKSYYYFHPMALPLGIAVLLSIHLESMSLRLKKFSIFMIFSVLSVNFLLYLSKIAALL